MASPLQWPPLVKQRLPRPVLVNNALWRDALAELAAMQPRGLQHVTGVEAPEKHWAYRLAKKYWFFGFGAYG